MLFAGCVGAIRKTPDGKVANWTLATGGNGNVCSFSSSLPLFLESILVRFTSFPLTLLFKLDILFESLLPMEPFLLPSLLSSPPGRGGVRKKSGSNSCCTPSSGSASTGVVPSSWHMSLIHSCLTIVFFNTGWRTKMLSAFPRWLLSANLSFRCL